MKTICALFYEDHPEFWDSFVQLEQSECDRIEVRLDSLLEKNPDLKHFDQALAPLMQSDKPLILTVRTQEEGGRAELGDEEYRKVLEKLFWQVQGTVHYVDVQLQALQRLDKKEQQPEGIQMEQTVLSFHDFSRTPDPRELKEIWQAMEVWQPAIEKIAVMPQSPLDVARLLYSCLDHPTSREKIAISMSEMGQQSRLLGDAFGSSYTFCSLKKATAPGQFSIEDIKCLNIL